MPHVVLKGPVTVEDIWLSFKQMEFHESGCHFKAHEAYLSDDKQTLLIRTLVVERDFPKNYFVKLTQRADEITINLEPLAGPERTDAVKRFLGICAWQIAWAEPETELINTNIKDFIRPPESN